MKADQICKFCLSFPDATENLQWGDDLCFKIRGKIFATIALSAVPQKLCFKCSPEAFAELIEREGIQPAPYVGRYKWAILDRLDAIGNDELRERLRLSYEMVAAKAPKRSAKAKSSKKRTSRQLGRSQR